MGGVFILVVVLLTVNLGQATDYDSDSSVQLLREYVRMNTTTHNDLTPTVEFWKKLAAEESLPINVIYFTEGYPIVVIKWPGTNSSASSIMLNSHMDVVPADEDEGWTYPPFAATLTDNGNIYGRGTQDMKSVSIQYFEALRLLRAEGVPFIRDVYMTLMPDEEVGAANGMIPFLQSEEFASLNVGFEMDEGSSYQLPMAALFYQDKVVWQIQVECRGKASHGSTYPETNNTATGKCLNVINRMFQFRDEQYEISVKATVLNAESYTTVNLNIMEAGTAVNIVPSSVILQFDIRLGTSVNEGYFEAQLRQWLSEAGSDIHLTFNIKNQQSPATVVTQDNPYFVAITKAAQEVNLLIVPVVSPGSTDARFVRNAGIPAFGFSPMPNTPLLLHAVDEYINAEIFLQGILVYKQIIKNLANIPADLTSVDPSVYLNITSVESLKI